MRKLEAEAGLPLTERVGRGLVLTDAGRALAAAAADVAVAIERAEAVWDDFRNDPTGTVSVSTFPTGGQMLLPGTLKRLAHISELTVDCTDRDPVSEGFPALTADFDIVLAHAPKPASFWRDFNVVAVPLMTEPLAVALPPGHRLADRVAVEPEDLIGERWIGVPDGFPFEKTLSDIFEAAGEPAQFFQRFGDTRITEALVAAGLGIALLPAYTAAGAYRDRIILKSLVGVVAERHIVVLMRPDRAERRAVRTVVAAFRAEAAAQLPPAV